MTHAIAGSSTAPTRAASAKNKRSRRERANTTLTARGEPMLWLCGGALALCLAMIVGALALVLFQGLTTFWPAPLVQLRLTDGTATLGEITRGEPIPPNDETGTTGDTKRQLLRCGNFELTNAHFRWLDDAVIVEESKPEWALLLERVEWGRFYGFPKSLDVDGKPVASEPAVIWKQFENLHEQARNRWRQCRKIETDEIGAINRNLERERLRLKEAKLAKSPDLAAIENEVARLAADSEVAFDKIAATVREIRAENGRYRLVLTTADGLTKAIPLAEIVRAIPANRLGTMEKLGVYFSRWYEFLFDEPREANSEGGVLPAIAGTVAITLIMCVVVVPFGVLTALYLREYATRGPLTSAIRIAVANLAGVPSIVFGVFGLGFFCYIIGANIDQLFFSANLPNPTYGKGGLLWASLTLALLTLPVVIVATEEAIGAVPRSMREGSFGCGASKWQTIHRIVLPQAMPGIMTGVILAIARGAGEVAPLMLVGAVKLTHEWPLDAHAPFLHPTRSFMHLGFHVYDLGFQSPNSEAARPLVYTTTLLLIGIIAVLNLTAVALRTRLRRRFVSSQF